jgi:hypothetical protein
MKEAAQALRAIMATAEPQLRQLEADKPAVPPPPGEWSAREILGHLIDSAANNHQRMVRAQYNEAANFPPYRQVDWVRLQHYNQRSWPELVDFWLAYNHHLAAAIETIPPEALAARCNIGQDEPVTLEFVVNDYLRHVRHHLNDLL